MNWLRARLRQWLGVPSMVPFADSLARLEKGARASFEAVDRNFDSTNGRVVQIEERNRLAWERIVALEVEHSALSKKQTAWEIEIVGRLQEIDKRVQFLEQQHGDLSRKQNELTVVMVEVRQLREMLADPKRQPISTRTTHQFRTLMEAD